MLKNLEKIEELLIDLVRKPDLIAISETKLKTKFNSFFLDISLYSMIPALLQVR